MTPAEARVFVIEDDSFARETIIEIIENDGHRVVGTASTREEALAAVPHFRELGVQVVTLDNKLGSDEAGEEILTTIKAQTPEIKTIGLSSDPLPDTDVDFGKNGKITKLGKIITNL